MKIRLAFLQLLPGKSQDENLEIGKKACIEAKEKGADIALFPEMWSDGYYLPQDEKELDSLSIDRDSLTAMAGRLFLTAFPGSAKRALKICACLKHPDHRESMWQSLIWIS